MVYFKPLFDVSGRIVYFKPLLDVSSSTGYYTPLFCVSSMSGGLAYSYLTFRSITAHDRDAGKTQEQKPGLEDLKDHNTGGQAVL